MQVVIQIWATMNYYVVGERRNARTARSNVAWPSSACEGEEDDILHRGGRLSPQAREWWKRASQPGAEPFRIQRGLATSKQQEIAMEFMNEYSYPVDYEKAYWRYHLPNGVKCMHVACLESETGAAGEQEFLFPPWSAFKGMSMEWNPVGYWQIDVMVERDNQADHLRIVDTCPWA
jgi:hypothetical protein